ncbi:MAG: hypothetical protein LBT71_08510 [Azoarcus sp.]|jgi:uncharacterized membrane protein YgcG|nr:hypothetical protein [Azoarcus sp.]
MEPSVVFSHLTDSLDTVQEAERDVMLIIDSKSKDLADDETRRLEAYRVLARLRLDEIVANAVSDDLTASETKARAKYETFTLLCAQVQTERRGLVEKIAQAASRRSGFMGMIEASLAEIATVEAGSSRRLEQDEAWTKLVSEALSRKNKLAAAREKALAREADRVNKSKPYLADKLFKYLYDRHYGTSAYQESGLTRWGDGFVARTIQYEAARRNFTLLNELPERLHEHADALNQALDVQNAALEKRFRETTVEDGIVPLEQKLGEQRKDLDDAENAYQSLLEELNRNRDRYQGLTEGDDENGLNAVLELIVMALKRLDLAALKGKALKTPTLEDDKIVHELGDLEGRIAGAQAELMEARKQLESIKQHEAELQKADKEVHAKCYDGDFTGDDDDITELIQEILLGAKKSGDLLGHLEKHFRPRPKTYYSSDSSSSFDFSSFSSSSSSSGGFGGGGFSSGGSVGGGGFRTGGGF